MDSPSLPDIDSASDRLARLDLIDANPRGTNMDDKKTDQVIEIPDTLDTPASMCPVGVPSRCSAGPVTSRHCRSWRDSGLRGFTGGTAPHDADYLFRQARLARSISETVETKPSRQAYGAGRPQRDLGNSLRLPVGARNEDKQREKGKGIDPIADLEVSSQELPSRSLLLDGSQKNMVQRRCNSYVSPCNMARTNTSYQMDGQNIAMPFEVEACSSFSGINDEDTRKGKDPSQPRTGQTLLRQSKLEAIPTKAGQRKLVRDGCISPHNIAKCKKVAKDNNVRKMVFSELSDGITSHQILEVSPDSEGSIDDKMKGKVILDDNAAQKGQHSEANSVPSRLCSITEDEVTVIADIDDHKLRSAKEVGRRTQYHREKASVSSFPESASVLNKGGIVNSQIGERAMGDHMNLVDDSPNTISSLHGSNPSPVHLTTESEFETRRRHRQRKHAKGKRKFGSHYSHFGESSASTLEDSEISYCQSSWRTSNPKLTRTHNSQPGAILGPDIEADELNNSEVRCSHSQEEISGVCGDSSARMGQVESDEKLARQLQEQFYNESTGFGGNEEVDATIAWSLQQEEEEARRAASIIRNGLSHPRDASIAHLYAHRPRMSSLYPSSQLASLARVPASSRMAQLRRNFNSPEMDLEMRMIDRLRRNFNSAEMDLEMRLNFLEALEAAFDNSYDTGFSDDVFQIHHDFNENDYEMLLALDDDNYQHAGASDSQISDLPQSVIESGTVEEPCAICLEAPSVGDVIRHLPCFHKFHKECIDTWLRRRTRCPICKSGIT